MGNVIFILIAFGIAALAIPLCRIVPHDDELKDDGVALPPDLFT
jgi:hypothetical protein